MVEQDMTDKITDLDNARMLRLVEKLCKENPALEAGYRPAEKLTDWYLEGGYSYGDMVHAMAYSAAAQVFRDLPVEEAEGWVRDAFENIIADLLLNGPHYGHEPY
jgi:hypothetical protein